MTVTRPSSDDGRRVAALSALGAPPALAAVFRLWQVTSAPDAADVVRFAADPVATAVHLVGVPVFVVGGAAQLHQGLRRRMPQVHRVTGRLVIASGIGIALTGAWMTSTWDLPAHDRTVGLTVARLVASSVMAGSLLQALREARRRRWEAHRAWALRGWAIGMGAGTQALAHVPLLLAGQSNEAYDPDHRFVAMLAGWLVNAAVAEYVIRRPTHRRGTVVPPARRAPSPTTRTHR